MAEDKKIQADWYMRVYQNVGGAVLAGIPNEDTTLSPRAQEQLKKANEHAVKMLDALANINTLIDNPSAEEGELF